MTVTLEYPNFMQFPRKRVRSCAVSPSTNFAVLPHENDPAVVITLRSCGSGFPVSTRTHAHWSRFVDSRFSSSQNSRGNPSYDS